MQKFHHLSYNNRTNIEEILPHLKLAAHGFDTAEQSGSGMGQYPR
jgi:hypothetical protein